MRESERKTDLERDFFFVSVCVEDIVATSPTHAQQMPLRYGGREKERDRDRLSEIAATSPTRAQQMPLRYGWRER
ncbi:MAG TPA: hypothetical protein V6C97_21920 [Oculatellaceae cyanobacterium]